MKEFYPDVRLLKKRYAFVLLPFFLFGQMNGQPIWMLQSGGPSVIWEVEDCVCPDCIKHTYQSWSWDNDYGFTVTPNGSLYGINDYHDLYAVDTATGQSLLLLDLPPGSRSLCATSDTTLLACKNGYWDLPDSLMEINLNTLTWNVISPLEYGVGGDFTFFNGDIYYIVNEVWPAQHIARINLANPAEGFIVVEIPPHRWIHGFTATRECNVLLSADNNCQCYVKINVADGTITDQNETPYINIVSFTSTIEFETIVCPVLLDLDCDDSSGAPDADYNSPDYNCVSEGVPVIDVDPHFLYDALIEEVSITMTGNLPDGAQEFLELELVPSDIDMVGSGTQMITLTNNGTANANEFINVVQNILYKNSSFIPTPGFRTVEIFFITYSGTDSNTGVAFIEVTDLEAYDVDLGPDITSCSDEDVILNTGLVDVSYQWSTGSDDPMIGVTTSGIYSVTVEGDEYCPAVDSVDVVIIPAVNVSLQEDVIVCANDELTLTIETDATFPITVQIQASPGELLTFTDVTGHYEIPINPVGDTYYSIESVFSNQPACFKIGADLQLFEIYPVVEDSINVSICEGDSIQLGSNWIYEEGLFTEYFQSAEGCDSIISFQVSYGDELTVFEYSSSCSLSDTGTFIQLIPNPDGCDTIVETTVGWLPLDTTYLVSTSCVSAETGVFTANSTSTNGCDSVIITSVGYTPPMDTTHIIQFSCDSNSHGDLPHVYMNAQGCDSVVIIHIVNGEPDTTKLTATSCDSSSLGIFEEHYLNEFLCDSVVITEIGYSANDSTFTSRASCLDSEVGVFHNSFINQFGCDSVVIETVTLIPEVHNSITSFTCDPGLAGIYQDTLISDLGCDSIIVVTIILQPADETNLFYTTCNSSEAGVTATNYINQYGCDSVVIVTVDFEAADTTMLTFYTCHHSEVGIVEHSYIGQQGCDSLVIHETELFPLPNLQVMVTSDYNGYPVSCFGANDGGATAMVQGIGPFQYLWFDGSMLSFIDGLSAGNYSVTITDGNGCLASSDIELGEPDEFSIDVSASMPGCFHPNSGMISIDYSGGTEPMRFSMDGIHFQSSNIFDGLSSGLYNLTAVDANDCEVKEEIQIHDPVFISVDLGDDQNIDAGQSTTLNAIAYGPFDSVAWSGLINPDCFHCLSQTVAPIITTTYTIYISNTGGCEDVDSITLFVKENNHLYIPNTFSPNGDQVNDILMVMAGSGVQEILEFTMLDRWGNVVFQNKNFQPNDPGQSWNGKMNDLEMDPAVFGYKLTALFEDGRKEVVLGSITLIK